jgi:hypothetical protein
VTLAVAMILTAALIVCWPSRQWDGRGLTGETDND